jgi:hypothetical protein
VSDLIWWCSHTRSSTSTPTCSDKSTSRQKCMCSILCCTPVSDRSSQEASRCASSLCSTKDVTAQAGTVALPCLLLLTKAQLLGPASAGYEQVRNRHIGHESVDYRRRSNIQPALSSPTSTHLGHLLNIHGLYGCALTLQAVSS